ncbi:uncharacterized protein GVI51_L12177 [Nakaseomyces glabratus]|mgnify:CR=1 FL=1|uniref:GPI transamidase component GAA1 n=2 Tax=Candida glabrata TaxID=5478 RepID=Q6FKE4_CANGA|nr:uncharacterized protein CAGL0L12232g [Nakaseomyces glabratus]KAH7581242.1 Gaa1-like, GPI transamidase component [Nakaseomyces glabratus]KAH7581952.1 Gaa1-like, GPI transamidase component [Nakaseomyces glabratus]KAH7594257.1 Gaa1-like, GPI transamidase component [Nakaseomyces glabratus]KAH7594412.1 Gaa1-like, GPI transamidase component [Nakaseomyces glabratus]KAH7601173.1 Gaa1-like, GPI transamidase component [Nakaseomyces glabratus]|eukprot:XP_449300.1 uncharacterized protein CAGL0L12232g [[Candida] glabrata]
MSLLQKVYRRLSERGAITKLLQQLPRVSNLLVVVAIVLLAILPLDGQYRRTYISENALMPSQAYSYFRETEWNILRGYRSQIETLEHSSVDQRNEVVAEWLQEQGLKTALYEHEKWGKTLYGVLHASRGDGTEAMVLAIPWKNVDDQFNLGGAALGVSLSQFFKRWPVWSKNIIVVFSEDSGAALRAWVDAYHTSLDLTAGSIEAAVVLDYPSKSDFFEYVEISYDGLNGELPNLDLVNIAVSITEHEGMKVSLHGLPPNEMYNTDYFARLKIMFVGIKNWALSGVKRIHGNEAFSGWRIQSVTLRAHGNEGQLDITCFGRIPEAMFRSVNNLLEKFHQSYFFYLLLAPRNFVSISNYLPSAVIISVAFAVISLDSAINNDYLSIPFSSVNTLVPFIILSASVFVSFLISRVLIMLPIVESLLFGSVALTFLPLVMSKKNIHVINQAVAYRLKSIGSIYYSLILTSLLMVNFALTFMIGLLAFPLTKLAVISTKTIADESRKSILKNTFILFITNPFISLWLFTATMDTDFNGSFSVIYNRMITSWDTLGCWTWFIICLGWLPYWLISVISSIPSQPIVERTSILDDKKEN